MLVAGPQLHCLRSTSINRGGVYAKARQYGGGNLTLRRSRANCSWSFIPTDEPSCNSPRRRCLSSLHKPPQMRGRSNSPPKTSVTRDEVRLRRESVGFNCCAPCTPREWSAGGISPRSRTVAGSLSTGRRASCSRATPKRGRRGHDEKIAPLALVASRRADCARAGAPALRCRGPQSPPWRIARGARAETLPAELRQRAATHHHHQCT